MELNINKIASDKIKSMHESGEIQERIEKGIESAVRDAIDSAVKDYGFRNKIEKSVEEELGNVAKEMNFSAYKNFLVSRVNKLINSHLKKDIASKVEEQFSKIYLNPVKEIKLSELILKYKAFAENYMDSDDKRGWGEIELNIEESGYGWLDIKAGKPKRGYSISFYESFEIVIHFESRTDKTRGWIGSIRLGGRDMGKQIDFGTISEFEALIFNLMFTKATVLVDMDEVNDLDLYFEDNDY